jgi:hypothetical protein
MADTQVANTILQQLGGKRFVLMTGSSNFVCTENSLTFRVPSAKNKITHVVITLEPSDTYTVEFLNCRMTANGYKREVVSTHEDVYFDVLEDVFERNTRLYTHM